MDLPPTCGEGLAEFAPLPDLLGRLTAAVAAVLEAHLPMLDVTDQDSSREREVYVELIEQYRSAAWTLREIGSRMAGARDLPMGRHVEAPPANVAMAGAFADLVECEIRLAALLEARLERDRPMLELVQEAAGNT